MPDSSTKPQHELALERTTPRVTSKDLQKREMRLRGSAISAGLYAAPVLYVVISIAVFIGNWANESPFFVHLVETLTRSLVAAVTCAGFVSIAVFIAALRWSWDHNELTRTGEVMPAVVLGRPKILGGEVVTKFITRTLGALWEPLAPAIGQRVPVFVVAFSFELDGKTVYTRELLYGDEEIILAENGCAWVCVDRRAPSRKAWLCREGGKLKDAPFRAERSG